MGLPTATVQMLGPDGITHVATGLGTGPVDAAYKAIDSLIRVPVRRAHLANLRGMSACIGRSGWCPKQSIALATCTTPTCRTGKLLEAVTCCNT